MHLKNEFFIAHYDVWYQDSLKITAIYLIIIVKEDCDVLLMEGDSHTVLTAVVILFNH